MKMYIFRDNLFCWVCGVVASSLEEAIKYAREAGHYVYLASEVIDPTDVEVKKIIPGLIVEGGGNG